jgi:hypothetical protein
MSESYVDLLKGVANVLDNYPSKNELFGINRNIVLVLNDTSKSIHNFLVSKYNKNYQLLVPNVLEADNATFVFFDFEEPPSTVMAIANKIYLRKVIFDQPITAKVLTTFNLSVFIKCKNCVGYYYCSPRQLKPCFSRDFEDYKINFDENLFKLVLNNLEFEPIDLKNYQWKVSQSTVLVVSKMNNKIQKEFAKFAVKVCNHLAPEEAYKHNNITKQNETYTRLQMMHQFQYGPHDIFQFPTNFEEVFQRSNVPMDSIKTDWIDIKEKYNLIRNWKYFDIDLNTPAQINEHHKNLRTKIPTTSVDVQMSEFLTEKNSSSFEKIIKNKFQDIAGAVLDTIVTTHAEEFAKQLQKLDFWLDDKSNMISLEHPNQTMIFFNSLQNEFHKYFNSMNINLIHFWLHRHPIRVPHDWQARLTGFERNDDYLVTGWYFHYYHYVKDNLELYLDRISHFSDFVNIVDYAVRESFELFGISNTWFWNFSLSKKNIMFLDSWYMKRIYNSREGTRNLSQFFVNWKDILRSDDTIEKLVAIFENKYQNTFKTTVNERELPDFWNCVKRFMFFNTEQNNYFTKPPLSWSFNLFTREIISDKLEQQAYSLLLTFKKHFIDRRVQELIRLESSKLDPCFQHINGILIQDFKSKLDNWRISQPYRKFTSLKYTYKNFDDFFREIEILFSTMHLPFPAEDFNCLNNTQSKFVDLEKLAKMLKIEDKMSTRSDWGRVFRSRQDYYNNSAVTLSSPINFGFKAIMSAVQRPTVGTFNFNSVLLIACVVFLKIRKLSWKY